MNLYPIHLILVGFCEEIWHISSSSSLALAKAMPVFASSICTIFPVTSNLPNQNIPGIPMEHGLLLAVILFCIGLTGLLIRRNIIFMLLSIEIMLNAAGVAFIVAGTAWGQADGQVMFIFILAMAAAEVSVGLALIIQFFKKSGSLDISEASSMQG